MTRTGTPDRGTVRTAHLGLGPIGLGALRATAARPFARIVGAIDVHPDLVGRDAGVAAAIEPLDVRIVPSYADVGPSGSADVVVHCTGSHLDRETDRVLGALAWGASVVSTCEELAFPWIHHPEAARRIDEAARAAERVVIATGINPGFAMDALAVCLSAVAERIERVDVHRVVDAATRRGPLQEKVGAGITAEAFAERRAAGTIGHIGLVESVALIAAALDWPVDRIEETLEPVLAVAPVRTEVVDVAAGRVAGIRQIATGFVGERDRIRLHLDMFVGAPSPGDTVVLEGAPRIETHIAGIHGDVATAAIVANAVGAVHRLEPGLRTALDLLPLRLG